MIRAVIFDMDGTLFDTNKEIFLSAKLTFKEYNKNLKYNDTKPYFGRGTLIYTMELAKKYKIKEDINILIKKRKNYAKQLTKKSLRTFPGIKKLLKELKKNKIKIVIATGSRQETVLRNLKRAGLNKTLFNVIISKDNTKYTKPNPEPFLKAIEELKVKHSEAIVIEDSMAGIQAANKAKIKSIAITNSFKKSELREADLIVNSANKLNLKKLNSV